MLVALVVFPYGTVVFTLHLVLTVAEDAGRADVVIVTDVVVLDFCVGTLEVEPPATGLTELDIARDRVDTGSLFFVGSHALVM